MPSRLQLIYVVNDPEQSLLLEDFLQVTPMPVPEFVRGDKTIAIEVRPVIVSETADQIGGRPWDDDWASGDIFRVGIGRPDEPPTGGTFHLELNGNDTGLTLLAYNITEANLQTALNAVSVSEGYGALTVDNPATGVYVVTWSTAGAAVPEIDAFATNLTPFSQVNVSVIYDGDETPTTYPQQVISLRQQLVAYSLPATLLPAAGVTRTYDQTATSSQNTIARISFDADGTYGGLYSINLIAGGISAACGQAGPLMTPEELGLVLANHPAIHYQTTDEANNVIVTMDGADFLVEFTGTLAGDTLVKSINDATVANPTVLQTSAAHGYRTGDSVTITNSAGITPSLDGTHTITVIDSTHFSIPVNVTVASGESATVFNNTETTLTVADVSLLAPTGVTGTIDLNTFNLANAFWATDDDEIEFTLSIERERASGEIRTGLLGPVTLKRDIIDVTSLVPVNIPGNLTANTGVNFSTVTGYTGGGSTNLDGIATVALSPILLYAFVHSSDGLRHYTLTAGTTAESSPDVIRPDDYAGGTNEKVWVSVG